jgi:hypothetical protein
VRSKIGRIVDAFLLPAWLQERLADQLQVDRSVVLLFDNLVDWVDGIFVSTKQRLGRQSARVVAQGKAACVTDVS